MSKLEAVKWYESLPDDIRMKLQRDFDLIYDNLGSREIKFYRWIKLFNKSKQKDYFDKNKTHYARIFRRNNSK